MNAQVVLIFLEEFHEEEIEDFLKANKFTIMDKVVQIKRPNNVTSYYPHIRSKAQLMSAFQNEDWDFSCVGMTSISRHLFKLRGIEEEGEMGIKIKEIQNGLYESLINIF